jgi:hypothetical protein
MLGLQCEYQLLRAFLEELGHEVHGLQYDEPLPEGFPACELCISLETVSRHLLSVAPIHWLFSNPEWFTQDLIPVVKRHFMRVFAKTNEAQAILEKIFPGMVYCAGFLSRDQFDPEIARERKFLHVGGNSALRNTAAVLDAWRWKQNGESIGAELTIISKKLADVELPDGVTVLDWVSEEELKRLQNSHAFHLHPSGTEGYGQALHESLSVNAAILTVDAPPMSEVASIAAHVPATGTSFFGLATIHEVSALDIHVAAKKMMNEEYLPISWETPPRIEWMNDNELFKDILQSHLEGLQPATIRPREKLHREFPDQKRVAFLGNFAHSFCTESDLAWSLEHLGHEVIRVPEDKGTIAELQASVLDADMFLWVHTHGWDSITHEQMCGFLKFLKERGIPSVFFHLDRYFGIPEREERIGVDPCWKCDFVFTADGGNDENFWARGVNHFWMQPGIVERGIHFGFPRGDLRCDVAFVGAGAGYHACYPFRAELLTFLHARYGPRFKHFEGVREQQLNDVYASAKVCIGDHIFAGVPRYASDRLPETCGRGGFLLYPRFEGLTIPCATYKAQDLKDLGEQIDRWLEQPVERRAIVKECMEHVRMHDTYTHRVAEILKKVFP